MKIAAIRPRTFDRGKSLSKDELAHVRGGAAEPTSPIQQSEVLNESPCHNQGLGGTY